ncbi:MAG: acyl-CoA dehydrogenase family protein [Alphaproteobacteria bacterium]|nr:acyl-CoA dehydrogenase family protein [Alphaproteobacteria bacterium]MBU1514285.1 acyl-CoA dehydrogenase family protein [Alphaproteobacteria bacterium]MBU2097073.1 acyl-CoA dehydrogenase family protein [Alphaproteobacteria bacterium]MBU2152547.1 acyl-CoA dehydrogenase family protein [Alphaproteobacteria bacterium]MBU2308484.1 acyl-CoA dehydrogenase family protein [Alphaproteobacteria bacterium]
MADFGGETETFRAEARDWLEANFPKALADKPMAQIANMQAQPESAEALAWRRAVGAKGWGTPLWPKEYGGGGLSRAEARVLAEEMAKVGARNPIGGMGVMMFGPTLIEYGTEALKREHLPGIVSGDVRWCQGYSEPGAGSDLAGLQTRAEDKGDHYLVNGSKIWTSGADKADRCFCLVRTDTSKKHEGISFLLIDMTDPGVEVRPILLINGTSPFCETFFTDVKVAKDQLFGPLNGGWTVAKRLLQFERDNISAGLGGGNIGQAVALPTVVEAAKQYVGLEAGGRLADAEFRRRITDHMMENRAFQLTVRRAQDEAKSNGPSNAAAIMKYAGAKIAQERNELLVEALGLNGVGWSGDGYSEQELQAVRTWLRSKGNSIEGGTSEINLNVVSKRVLGLPDPK